ncbi:MAG: S1-C subfamily serine protease, partial [Pseudohongiellaceae bacterium]
MSYRISVRFSKIIAMAVVVLVVAQAQAISTAALRQGIPSLAPMLEQVTPAVVSIRVSKAMPTSGRGSEQMGRPYATGAGSGVIVDAAEGLIITNHHVVDGASRITVR